MAQKADGSLVIEVDLTVDEANKALAKLKKEIEKTEDSVNEKEQKKASLVEQAEELRQKIKEAKEEVKEYGRQWAAGVAGADALQIKAQDRLSQLKSEYSEIVAQIDKMDKSLLSAYKKLDSMKEEAGLLQRKINDAGQFSWLEQAKAKIKEVVSATAQMIGKAGSGIGSIVKKAGVALKNVASGIVNATKQLNVFSKISKKIGGTLKKLGSMVKRAFVFSVVNKGLSLIKQQVASYLTVNTELSAALGRLKGALLTAFQPIYDFVVPVLTALINRLTSAMAAVAQFTAALFGTTAKQAKQNASALYKQAKATEEAGDAADSAAGSLASFDEINTLASGDLSTQEAAETTFDFALDGSKFASWGQAFSAFLDKLLNYGLPALGAGLAKISEKINGLSEKLFETFTFPGVLEKVKSIGASLATAFNEALSSINWVRLGQAVGAGLNIMFMLGSSFVSGFSWAGLGQSIADGINGIVSQIDWHNLGTLLFSGFKIGLETLAGLLIRLDMAEIGQAASNLVMGFFNSAVETLAGIDWEEIGHQVKEFLVNIDWGGIVTAVFETIGAAFAASASFLWGFIEDAWKTVVDWWQETAYEDGKFTLEGLLDGILDVVKNIGAWIKDNIFKPFVDGFKKVFGIHSPSKVMKEQGDFLMQGLLDGITEKVGSVTAAVEEIFNGITSFVKNVFSKDWKGAWEDVSGVFKGIWNGIIGVLEGAVNLIISGVNWLITQLNKISFTVPDWVPGVGGKSIGINIQKVSSVSLPRLATGAVIPPNREFLAVLGDQKQGTNIEAPEALLRKIAREESGMNTELLEAILAAIEAGHVMLVDKKVLAKTAVEGINDMTRSAGKPVLTV